MKATARVLGLLALILTIAPALFNATGILSEAAMKALMLAGTILWFATAPFWLKAGDH